MAKWALSDHCWHCGATPDCEHKPGCLKSMGAYQLPNGDLADLLRDGTQELPRRVIVGPGGMAPIVKNLKANVGPDVRDAAIIKTEGRKDDGGKARYDLTPPEVEEAIAKVLAFGAAKYGERNWERGMNWGRPFAALRRHMASWWGGEDNDPETGMSHLWHACANIAFLIAFEQRKIGTDDRP